MPNPLNLAALQQAQASLALAEARWDKVMRSPNEIYDKNIAEAELQKAQADFQAAVLRLTPTPTKTASPTATPTPVSTVAVTRPVEDVSRVYAKISGRVVGVRIAAITGNEMTIEFDVYPR